MPRRLLPLLFALAAFSHLRAQDAQDEPIHMRPEFALNFPLALNGHDVTVKYPVMINPTTVLKPGMVLHVIYLLNHDSGGASNLVLAHKGTQQDAFARTSGTVGGDAGAPKMDPQQAHEIEGYRHTKWDVPNNFVLAMAQYPTDVMHLIYSPTGQHDLEDERFSFFDGMFIGSPAGKVAVIAVEKQSKADMAGIKAGDEIESVGGYPTHDDLATFASAYSAAKKDARDNETESFQLMMRTAGGAESTVNVPMPQRIKSALMNDFFNKH